MFIQLKRILRALALARPVASRRAAPDADKDRRAIESALKTRLPPHIRRDVGGGD